MINRPMLAVTSAVGAAIWLGSIALFVAACDTTPAANGHPSTPDVPPAPITVAASDLYSVSSSCDQYGNRVYTRTTSQGGGIAVSPKDPSCPQGVR